MKRLAGFFVVLLLSALLAAPVAAGSGGGSVERKAKRAASGYVQNHFGMSYPYAMWKTECDLIGHTPASWKCQVRTEDHKCSGTLRVRERQDGGFKAYDKQIDCNE